MTNPGAFGPFSFGVPEEDDLVLWQKHYRLDDEKIASSLATQLKPVFADLLDLALAVYVTDRICPRRPKGQRNNGAWWRRRLHLRVAVREHDRWVDPTMIDQVHRLLGWLTDDDWEIEFLSDPSDRRMPETQSRLFVDPPAAPTQVALFSGGLDSLLGAIADASLDQGELILVGAGTHSRMIGKQGELVRQLAPLAPRRLRPVIVPVGLTSAGKELLPDKRGEQTQRSRGFVFLALGAAVAGSAGCSELRVHENGPGALNLPLTPGQQGSMNTRAARPETLEMMSALISSLTGEEFKIVNPAFWSTKAEMCRGTTSNFMSLMKRSVSCDGGLTRRDAAAPLCGTCTSCLLRRQALLAAGLTEVDQADLERMAGDGLAATRRHADPMVLAMLQQVAQLDRALSAPDPWQELINEFPELGRARRSLQAAPHELVELLSHYVDDWRKLSYSTVREFLPARCSSVPSPFLA